jgi:predicted O-methyltransferase YrrM
MRFNPLDHPLALLAPKSLSDVPKWIGHIPFAFALIEMSEPRTVVELGTFKGDSYLAFCQAVAALELPTKCFAVDTWKGDAQTGFYGDPILAELRARHDPLYGRFSTLVQKEFDAALGDFADGSIDLLHIDGTHDYASVKHDYESWLPKMSDAGVMLFHDTAVRAPTYDVSKLWDEIAPKCAHFAFEHSYGLGVLGVGKNVAAPVKDFFESVTGDDSFKREEAQMVRAYFNYLGTQVQQLQLLGTAISQMHRQQTMINNWKHQAGRPVDPQSADIHSAFADCVKFSRNLTRDLQLLIEQQPR